MQDIHHWADDFVTPGKSDRGVLGLSKVELKEAIDGLARGNAPLTSLSITLRAKYPYTRIRWDKGPVAFLCSTYPGRELCGALKKLSSLRLLELWKLQTVPTVFRPRPGRPGKPTPADWADLKPHVLEIVRHEHFPMAIAVLHQLRSEWVTCKSANFEWGSRIDFERS